MRGKRKPIEKKTKVRPPCEYSRHDRDYMNTLLTDPNGSPSSWEHTKKKTIQRRGRSRFVCHEGGDRHKKIQKYGGGQSAKTQKTAPDHGGVMCPCLFQAGACTRPFAASGG